MIHANGMFWGWRDSRSSVSSVPFDAPPFFFKECGSDILGARVTSAGEVLDPEGIPIATVAGQQRSPKVLFGGGRYLVVWNDTRAGNFDLYGTFVAPDGTTAAPTNGFPISASLVDEAYPSLAFDGTDFLVTYTGEDPSPSVDPADRCRRGVNCLFASRITPAGTVLDPFISNTDDRRIEIRTDFFGGFRAVAFGDGVYLVDAEFGDWAVVAQDGTVRPSAEWPSLTAPPGEQFSASNGIAFNGEKFLVAWASFPSTGSIFDPVNGARVLGSLIDLNPGQPPTVGGAIPISSQRGGIGGVRVVWDGRQFVSAWHYSTGDAVSHYSEFDVFGARITPDGTVVNGHDLDIMGDMEGQGDPALAVGNANLLVVWVGQQPNTPPQSFDIFGQTVTFPGLFAYPKQMRFFGEPGAGVPLQQLFLVETSGTEVGWAASVDASWLSVSPSSGTTPSGLTVSANPDGLGEGTHSGAILLALASDPTHPVLTIPVTLLLGMGNLQLISFSGDGQETGVGEAYREPLVVKAIGSGGFGLPGVPLTWEVTSGGATFAATGTTTFRKHRWDRARGGDRPCRRHPRSERVQGDLRGLPPRRQRSDLPRDGDENHGDRGKPVGHPQAVRTFPWR